MSGAFRQRADRRLPAEPGASLPSPDEARNAADLHEALTSGLREGGLLQLELHGVEGEIATVSLMPSVAQLVLDLLLPISQDKAVTLVPTDAMLTTQKAADILNVSRPHLIKLLDAGALRHEMVGRHRRLRAEDVLAFREKREGERDDALSDLAWEDSDLI